MLPKNCIRINNNQLEIQGISIPARIFANKDVPIEDAAI